jgi:hypothetical protein
MTGLAHRSGSDEALADVADEIRFYLEKSFQVSFGYLGVLVALGIAVHYGLSQGVAQQGGINRHVLVAGVLVTLNALYLTSALGMLFGVLKRGLFVIANSSPISASLYREGWIRGIEKERRPPCTALEPRSFFWNLDNYSVVLIFGVVTAVSIGALSYGFSQPKNSLELTILVCATAIQVVPAASLLAVARLDRRCRNALRLRWGLQDKGSWLSRVLPATGRSAGRQ